MGVMMTGTLKFRGPKGEAKTVISPTVAFLKVAGKVPCDKTSCPK